MPEIKCSVFGCIKKEDELHHIIPKSIGGIDRDGRVYLCKKHHDIIHKILLRIVWKYIPENLKEKVKESIKKFTLSYINKQHKK